MRSHVMWRSAKLLLSCVVVLAMAIPSQAALVNGLQNYWNYDNNQIDQAQGLAGSASTIADNGTFSQGVVGYGAGLLGSAGFQSDGETGFTRVTNSADTNHAGGDLTISTWFEVDAFDTSWQGLISSGEGSDYRIARSGSSQNLAYAGGTGDITAGVNVGAGTGWHHALAITENGVSTRLWIDGVLQVTSGGAPNLASQNTDLFIGANPEAGGREWEGQIDDTAMWNRVLGAHEIATIYNGGLGGDSLGALIAAQAVPEPSTLLLAALGAVGIAFRRRRRRRA